MQNPKILCSITHGLYHPWNEILQDGQARTWLSGPLPDGFQVVHFHAPPMKKLGIWLDSRHEAIRWANKYAGKFLSTTDNILLRPFLSIIPSYQVSTLLNLKQPSFQINFVDSYLTMRWKDIGILSYFLNETKADYLFMTTTSSYIRAEILINIVEGFNEKVDYAGAIHYKTADFAAGNNRLISRELAQALILNRKLWEPGTIEDVALGNMAKNLGYAVKRLPHISISSIRQLRQITDAELMSNFHFRLKSLDGNFRADTLLMHILHSRLIRLTGKI